MYTKNILSMYSKTVLLADDTPLFIRLAKDLFRRHQVDILVAQDGHEAVELVKEHKPNLVLMDLYMPGCNGDEACKQIKSSTVLRSIPVIMITSSDNPRDIERCLAAKCDQVFQKPLTMEHVRDINEKYLNLPGWSGKRVELGAVTKFHVVPEKPFTGSLLDISVGGVFLETAEFFPLNTELNLEFQLNQEKASIVCKGRVSWVNCEGNFKTYETQGVGLEFVDIKKLDILAIQAFVRTKTSLD